MKSKLLIFIIIISSLLLMFSLPAMASSDIVRITRPDGNEIVEKSTFSICGVCTYDETYIEFQYKDRDTDKYRVLYTTDGDSSFKVGSSRLFGKNVELKYKGVNHIRVIAYRKDSRDDAETKYFTITYTEEKKNNLIDSIGNAINWLTDKFN